MTRAYLLAAIFLLQSVTVLAAGDPKAGQQKSAPCQACHGADGKGMSPQFPKLAGQYADYLVHALQQYKNGERKNPIMAPFAQPLSPRDMDDLAAYFAGLPGGVFRKP